MKEPKHSPAPWKYDGTNVLCLNDTVAVCELSCLAFEEQDANGALIEAAPELLAVCKRVLAWVNKNDLSYAVALDLTQTISKAEEV